MIIDIINPLRNKSYEKEKREISLEVSSDYYNYLKDNFISVSEFSRDLKEMIKELMSYLSEVSRNKIREKYPHIVRIS